MIAKLEPVFSNEVRESVDSMLIRCIALLSLGVDEDISNQFTKATSNPTLYSMPDKTYNIHCAAPTTQIMPVDRLIYIINDYNLFVKSCVLNEVISKQEVENMTLYKAYSYALSSVIEQLGSIMFNLSGITDKLVYNDTLILKLEHGDLGYSKETVLNILRNCLRKRMCDAISTSTLIKLYNGDSTNIYSHDNCQLHEDTATGVEKYYIRDSLENRLFLVLCTLKVIGLNEYNAMLARFILSQYNIYYRIL